MSMDKWFYEQARVGNVYSSSTAASGAFTKIHATSTGMMLENPFGSGKNLVMKGGKFVGTSLTTIGEVGIAVNPTTSTVLSATTTAAVIHAAINVGSDVNTGVGLAYTIATLSSTPVWLETSGSGSVSSAVNTTTNGIVWAPNGCVIVPPGSFVAWACLTVVRNGMGSFVWAEIDE